MLLSTVMVIWGLKYLIFMPEIDMAEGIFKVHVFCLKYHHWLARCIIFRVYLIIIFEIKGVCVNQVQNSTLSQTNTFGTQNFNISCAVAINSLSCSIVKSCSHWNSNTLAVIVGNGKRLCDNPSFKWKFFTGWFSKDCWSFWSWSNSRSFTDNSEG